jgi:hypothetical protein
MSAPTKAIRAVTLNRNIYEVGQPNSFSGQPGAMMRVVEFIIITERNGQMAPVPYVEIWAGGQLWIEFDAHYAQGIEYF